MREQLRQDLHIPGRSPNETHPIERRHLPSHVGLAYDVYAPIVTDSNDAEKRGRVTANSIDPSSTFIDSWLDTLALTTVSSGYRKFYDLWCNSFESEEAWLYEATTSSRLLIGHGNSSGAQVGLTVHHTWGVPIIPGSALKGLLAQYVQITYGPDQLTHHPLDDDRPEPLCSPFQGVRWNGKRIVDGPGEIYRILFGAPDAMSDRDYKTRHPHLVGASQGHIIFHDALLKPSGNQHRPFARDVLTVHQKPYYDNQGANAAPADYHDPNPVQFLTVKPGETLLIALSGPSKWAHFALELLQQALAEWGVGGKTTSGYGRFALNSWTCVHSPLASNLASWFQSTPLPPAPMDIIATIAGDWGAEFTSPHHPLSSKRAAWAMIKDKLASVIEGNEDYEICLELLADELQFPPEP